jgi:Domain of unknown function (DUF4345)
MTLVLRVLIGLWGLLFSALAMRGILNPQFFSDQFGVVGAGAAINSVRADFGALFLVAGGAALWAALDPRKAKLCYVSAALFGTALAARALGQTMGDPSNASIQQAMLIEAVSVALLIFAARQLAPKGGSYV